MSMLIDKMYEAVLDPGQWSDFLAASASMLGASGAHLISTASVQTHGFWIAHGIEAEAIRMYDSYYRSVDPWLAALATLAPREYRSFRGESLVPDKQLLHTEFYREFLKPLGVRWLVGCHIAAPAPMASPYALCYFRTAQDAPFGDEAEVILNEFGRHLSRIDQLGTLNGLTQAGQVDDATALFFLSAKGRLIECNQPAAVLAEQGFSDPARRTMRLPSTGAGLWLQSLIASPRRAGDARPKMLTESFDGFGEFALELLPFQQQGASPSRRHIAFVLVARRAQHSSAETLAALATELFHWTSSEFDIVYRLTNGETPTAIATARSSSLATIRSHLKSAKKKAGANRQVDLVRLFMQLNAQ